MTALCFQTPRWLRRFGLRRPYVRYRLLRWQLQQRPSALIIDCTFIECRPDDVFDTAPALHDEQGR